MNDTGFTGSAVVAVTFDADVVTSWYVEETLRGRGERKGAGSRWGMVEELGRRGVGMPAFPFVSSKYLL